MWLKRRSVLPKQKHENKNEHKSIWWKHKHCKISGFWGPSSHQWLWQWLMSLTKRRYFKVLRGKIRKYLTVNSIFGEKKMWLPRWWENSNNFNRSPVPVVLKKKGKTSKNCYNLGPTCINKGSVSVWMGHMKNKKQKH